MRKLFHSTLGHLHFHITGVHPPKGFTETLLLLFFVLGAGTTFYAQVEGWSVVDSFYFSVMTITTVGYGDLHPTSPASKLFTVFYVFLGIGLGLYVITTFAESIVEGREKRARRLKQVVDKLRV